MITNDPRYYSGVKVKIKNDAALLYREGKESLRDTPEVFNNIYTIKHYSYGYCSLQEDFVNQFDFSPDLLSIQK